MKRLLYKSTVLIAVTFFCMLFVEPVRFYFEPIDLYVGYTQTCCGAFLGAVLWLCSSPARKYCCDGTWSELLFYLLPLEAFSLLYFAQWNLILSILLFMAVGALSIMISRIFKEKEETKTILEGFSPKRHRRYNKTMAKICVAVAAAFWAAPCVFAVAAEFQMPAYEAEKMTKMPVFMLPEEEFWENEKLFYENRELILSFEEERWKEYSIQEKVNLLQELADFEACRLGIPKVSVKSQKLGLSKAGEYDWDNKELCIDIQYIKTVDVKESMSTICHEMMHASQSYLVHNIDWEQEVFQKATYFKEIREWKENADSYFHAEEVGYDTYVEQPLEEAANAYAESEVTDICAYIALFTEDNTEL